MVRKIGLFALGALVLLVGLWIAALVWLPDALPPTVKPPATDAGTGDYALETPLLIPVKGMPREAVRDSWGDPRDNGQRPHHGTDIPAAPNTPVLAAAPGVVEKLWNSAAGGVTAYVRSPKRRWTYYYAHLSAYAPGLREGQLVKAGDPIGYVGDTGNAGTGNYHLHFGLTRTTPAQRWHEGVDVDPYPYLAGKTAAR